MTKKKERAASPRPPDRGAGATAAVGRQALKAAARLNAADGTARLIGNHPPPSLGGLGAQLTPLGRVVAAAQAVNDAHSALGRRLIDPALDDAFVALYDALEKHTASAVEEKRPAAGFSGFTFACKHGPWEDRCGICDPSLGATLGAQGPAAKAARQALLELTADVQEFFFALRAGAQEKLLDTKVQAIGASIRDLSQKLHIVGDLGTEAQVAAARASGFREAARMTDRSSDLIRKTRGGVARACSELDMATRDLTERADQILAGQPGRLTEAERDRRREAMKKVFALLGREHRAKGEHGTATLLDLFPEFHEALTGWKP